MPTINMSSVWVKISTILFLCYTAETHRVQKEVGGQITIQCTINSAEEFLWLKRGINKEHIVYAFDKETKKESFLDGMKERIQTHGTFPNVQILIKNLNKNDTNVYWCVYRKTDLKYKNQITDGNGTVLLVVTENSQTTSTIQQKSCKDKDKEKDKDYLPLYIIGGVAALLIIILSFVTWTLRKAKSSDNRVKTNRIAHNNDVYEDMRGTIRR